MQRSWRIGFGFDIHPFQEGRPLVLGGVTLPSPRGLQGHSDADVLTHAIMDALLGAAALGDIGVHFPETDPRFSEAQSLTLLAQVVEMVARRGYQVAQVDVTLVTEAPRVAPWFGQMRAQLTRVLGVREEELNLKATTAEGLGAIGRGEGIACYAVALLQESE